MNPSANELEEVDRYWFETLSPSDWFRTSEAIDESIRTRFGALLARWSSAPPDPASLDARGHVDAVVVLDQFPRNLHRGHAAAFATDAAALAIAQHAVDAGLDHALDPSRRHMLYMPFMHAEHRALQARSVASFEALGLDDALAAAREHRDLIERFGRFPARNAALGRRSTDAEQRFLASTLRRKTR